MNQERDAGAIEERVLEAAAGVLSRRLSAPVGLEPASGPRGPAKPVLRCSLTSSQSGAPPTAIVKYVPHGSGGDSPGFLNEWAALQFLSELELDPPVSPAFYGGDMREGVLVIEDLGDGDAVSDLLLGSDASRAEVALVAFARALGRMQAASIERVTEHRRMREALGPPGGETIIEASALGIRFARALTFNRLPPHGAAEDVEAVIGRIARPGPFLALVHGDACPSNEQVGDHGVVLLDFATAGLRHALLDGVCGRVPFPSCWCARRLPAHVPALMEEGYRSELVRGCGAAEDDAEFALAALTATAYWLIETTTVALSDVPFRDSAWGISTIGQRLALRVKLFAELADGAGTYRDLAAVLTQVVESLGLAGEEMPLYPAFGGPAI